MTNLSSDDDFIAWIIENKPDPWKTMADDIIMWGDTGQLARLKEHFFQQYEAALNATPPMTITLKKLDGTEINLKPRTNYQFSRLTTKCMEDLKKGSVTAEELAEWLIEHRYYELT